MRAAATSDCSSHSNSLLRPPLAGAPLAGPPPGLDGSNGTNHGPNHGLKLPHEGWEHVTCAWHKAMRHPCLVLGPAVVFPRTSHRLLTLDVARPP
ncbi:F-box/kelch-repeat protein [Dorcoceras hygrometricum]|uniref:F-box/kelch-repeat protein n=1 Tax=Dorcoceras hygrometricum TaxID=472368 RepID=A0A2Z7BG74_9LAMI|nr:F-box/kelch-repeat protein [Dorcoceras hygrometricum]